MKQGFYIAQLEKSTLENKTIGVSKKILDQIDFFNSMPNTNCEFISFQQKLGKIGRLLSFFRTSQYDCFFEKIKNADFLYIRAIIPNTKSLISFFKRIKSYNSKCKILYEIPTYPYDKEMKTLKNKVFLMIDKKYRMKLKEVIDYIVTFSDDNQIWGAKTLHIMNGIDTKRIPIAKRKNKKENEINLIAVAQFNFWHGYDRLLKGMYEYYNNKEEKIIINLHLIGNDNAVNYKTIVENTVLQNHVYFHGELQGKQLDDVFDIADIAVCSLGCHRKNLFGKTSELKSREYLSRGLPIISSIAIDIIPDDYKYCFYVPENDFPINIYDIIQYSENIYREKSQSKIYTEIRNFAEEKCTMKHGMKSVYDFINS